jgi:hypothetical protein
MTKFTHGPWTWKEVDFEYGLYDENDDGVITLYHSDPDTASISVSSYYAPLISAAPELLEACKAALSALESHQAYDKDMRPELRAVIRKAEGK